MVRARPRGRAAALYLAIAAYLIVLLALTLLLFPAPAGDGGRPFVHLQPLGTIGPALAGGFDLGSQPVRVIVGNIAAFVPVGILLPLVAGWRHPWLAVLVGGLLLSTAIELAQLAISLAVGYPYRQADVDDVLLNTLGALVGYAGLVMTTTLWRAWSRRRGLQP